MATPRKPKPPLGTPMDRPATTPEGEENRLIAKAHLVAERQMDDGTIASGTLVHYLRLSMEKTRLENAKLEREIEWLKTRQKITIDQAEADIRFEKALEAFRGYVVPTRSFPDAREFDD